MRTLSPLLALALPLALLPAAACGDKDEPAEEADADTDTDTDADTDADTDTDTDTDTDSDTDADIESVALSLDATEITSRETATYTFTVTYTDGSSEDLATSEDPEVSIDDSEVFDVFTAGTVQPLDAGTATLTLTYGGQSDSADLTVTVSAPEVGELLINELLTDGKAEGDPNGDGSLDAVDDEFIEIVNTSDVSLDLSGVVIVENEFSFLPRHTFAEGTTLRAHEAVVVFGGGDVSALSASNAWFMVADNEDSGTAYGLDLGNSGDRVLLKAADDTVLDSVTYGDHILADQDAVRDASMVSETEPGGDTYVDHSTVGSASYSPGTYADGTEFLGIGIYSE